MCENPVSHAWLWVAGGPPERGCPAHARARAGNWDYFCSWVELSTGVNFAVAGDHRKSRTPVELVLADECAAALPHAPPRTRGPWPVGPWTHELVVCCCRARDERGLACRLMAPGSRVATNSSSAATSATRGPAPCASRRHLCTHAGHHMPHAPDPDPQRGRTLACRAFSRASSSLHAAPSCTPAQQLQEEVRRARHADPRQPRPEQDAVELRTQRRRDRAR